jgi:hypothetical protein
MRDVTLVPLTVLGDFDTIHNDCFITLAARYRDTHSALRTCMFLLILTLISLNQTATVVLIKKPRARLMRVLNTHVHRYLPALLTTFSSR